MRIKGKVLFFGFFLLTGSVFSEKETVSAGAYHSLAVVNGEVFSWGYNEFGQLGLGTIIEDSIPFPSQVEGLSEVQYVSSGYFHSLALTSNGEIFSWGKNDYGQLGVGNYENSNIPVKVFELEHVISISAGMDHSLALTSDGKVWAWGANFAGQLGIESISNSNVPVQVQGNLNGVIDVSAGNYHSVSVKSDGTVWTWGNNSFGQLGDGTFENHSLPIQVSNLEGIITVSAGALHNLVIQSSGGFVWSWGYNAQGQLGDGTNETKNSPVRVLNLVKASFISAGEFYSLAVKFGGNRAVAWGENENGQLGDGSNMDSNVPVTVKKLINILAISAGGHHSLSINSNGYWSWGYNYYGQLGDGTYSDRNTPIRVEEFYPTW